MTHIIHPIPPFYDENSKVLILGSFPSVKSREQMFFYGHPQNRFWKMLADIFGEEIPASVDEKKALLKKHRIAVWDVIKSCKIEGSSDSSITDAVPNDINEILSRAGIGKIILNGKTAEKYYNRFIRERIETDAVCLPSTSPANAAWSLGKLTETWEKALLEALS